MKPCGEYPSAWCDVPLISRGFLVRSVSETTWLFHRTISQRPLVRTSGARIHFIDDRLETLKAVRKASDLHDVQLYLADWYVHSASMPILLCAAGPEIVLSAEIAGSRNFVYDCRGYNTEEERQAAAKSPGIKVLTLPQCCELLKWGIIMEVHTSVETSSLSSFHD